MVDLTSHPDTYSRRRGFRPRTILSKRWLKDGSARPETSTMVEVFMAIKSSGLEHTAFGMHRSLSGATKFLVSSTAISPLRFCAGTLELAQTGIMRVRAQPRGFFGSHSPLIDDSS